MEGAHKNALKSRVELGLFKYDLSPSDDADVRVWKPKQELGGGYSYEGQWDLDGKRDGFGVFISRYTYTLYEGYWKNDYKNGRGRLFCFGSYYEG